MPPRRHLLHPYRRHHSSVQRAVHATPHVRLLRPAAGSYFVLNVLLWIEAANRHGTSEKGKALRGEVFMACGTAPCLDPNDPNAVEAPESPLLLNAQAGRWYPIAKGFGQLLNLNCAVMSLPVVRSLVMFLHDATSFRAPWWLRWVPYILPLDKNIVFHKVCPATDVRWYHVTTRAHSHGGHARARTLLSCAKLWLPTCD